MDTRLIDYGGFLALADLLGEEGARRRFRIGENTDLISHFGLDEERNDILVHYGTPRHSGRYPWGSGENPYQRYANFKGHVQRMRDAGLNDTEIARSMKMTTSVFRAKLSYAEDEMRKEKVSQAVKLRDKGYSYEAIAKRMDLPNESSVRSLLDKKSSLRTQQTQNTIDMLKQAVDDNKYVDVGGGVEKYLGVSNQKLKNAVLIMEEQGYKTHKIYQVQQASSSVCDSCGYSLQVSVP